MKDSTFALILTIFAFLLLVGTICYCNNTEMFSEKSYRINNVFVSDNKKSDADLDLVLVEEKPKNINAIDRVIGKNNDSKIDFYIKKNKKSFKINIPNYNNYNFDGRGLVIAANGIKYRYVTGVYMNLYVIRNLYKSDSCRIVYVGKDESFNPEMIEKLLSLQNVTLIDLTEKLNTNIDENKLKGYRTKPLSVIVSSFKEVVLMDADALSFIDPSYFFELEGYKNKGMFLFKDYVNCLHYIDRNFIDNIGIGHKNYCDKTEGFELDSSCVVVNKELAWEALYAICIINVESNAYYNSKVKNVLGDKDTWLIGSMFVGFDPHISESNPGLLLSYTKTGMRVVWGHLQMQKAKDFDDFSTSNNIPLYYNNQAIDLSNFTGMDKWGYTTSKVKNPKMLEYWSKSYTDMSEEMKKTFSVASMALNDIINIINITTPPNSNKHMIVKNLIN